MSEKPHLIKILEDAQLAHRAGDFTNALKFYEHFFDHALDDDPYALYGVRLSHCLQGWANLAGEFPGAKNRLEYKKRDLLEQFQANEVAETFHDYLSVSRHLGLEQEAVGQFLAIHTDHPALARKLVRFLWDDLIIAEQWDVCSELLVDPNLKLDELFSIFDEAAGLKELDPSFDNDRFEQHITDTLLTDVQNVVAVLRYANRADDIDTLQRQFHLAVAGRKNAVLQKLVQARSSYLFSGH